MNRSAQDHHFALFPVICSQLLVTQTPNNLNLFLFPLKVWVIESRLYFISPIFTASLRICAVKWISFLQLENLCGSIPLLAFSAVTVASICIWRCSMSTLGAGGAFVISHWLSGRYKNSGPFFHLPCNSLTQIPHDRPSAALCSLGYASTGLDRCYFEFLPLSKRQTM